MIKFFLILSCSVMLLMADQNKNTKEQLCAVQKTCTSCIQTPTCIWCSKIMRPAAGEVEPVRCIPRDKYNKHWCSTSQVINETSSIIKEKDIPLTSLRGTEPVQVKPQRLRVRLRKGEEKRLSFNYSQAEDYPVDLYYLMDLSASMAQYKTRLSELGVSLAAAMRNLTSNFRLGFGSFVDKVVLPMTDTQPSKLKTPCVYRNEYNERTKCASPYGYQHQMSLADDANLFRDRVKAAPISGNLDAPEGGFDALMQAMVCLDRIGWRQKARRLIVFSTDASFHLAGDGRLAGIVEPNDCQCHLDETGIYTYSLIQDYPSISQINRIAQQHSIRIIFAVSKKKNDTYQLLSQSIVGSSIGIVEKTDTDNVIDLIKKQYERLVGSVELTDNTPDYISVQYFSKCLNKSSELKQRSKCNGLRFGNVIEFDIVLKLLECPSNPSEWKQKYEIKPLGLNESLSIEVELICDCPCDKTTDITYQTNSTHCKSHGNLICGVCSCSPGYNGKYCDCSSAKNEMASGSGVNTNCRASVNDTEDCNGNGACECGSCECYKTKNPQETIERFGGPYCECDNYACPRKRVDGKYALCGDKGNCACGTCDCYPGWIGDDCGCHDNTTCFPPAASGELSTEICSGHGDCICGHCQCRTENNIHYTGEHCEDCPTCSGLLCAKLSYCVECLWKSYQSKITGDGAQYDDDGCSSCHDEIDLERIDKVEINSTEHEDGVRLCRIPTDDGCTFAFKYQLLSKRGDISLYKVFVQEKKDCPSVTPVVGVAIGVVVSTVVLGLIGLIIWKVVTTIHDQHEYAKFEKERATAKWERGENPLYKKPTTTFCNPTFENVNK